jgi:hypothetical protein
MISDASERNEICTNFEAKKAFSTSIQVCLYHKTLMVNNRQKAEDFDDPYKRVTKTFCFITVSRIWQ